MGANFSRKLNIGCGYDYRDGWLNVDDAEHHDNVDLSADATDLSMLPEGYFDYIVARDVLEHIDRPKQADVVKGWSRLLSKNGVLWIRVPSFLDLAWLARTHPEKATAKEQHNLIQCGWGTQAYPGDYHTCCYTPLTLIDIGEQAGVRIAGAQLKDEWLFEIEFKRIDSEVSNLEWLNEAYMRYLWRPADPAGRDHYLAYMESTESGREDVAKALGQAAETEMWRRG